jgi:prophage DNA circulation protein
MNPLLPPVNCFPMPPVPPPHMNPTRVTPDRSNVYQSVSSQPTAPPIHSDMSIASSTEMETFQLYIDDLKEDVQELKNGMQNIHKMLQQLITPTATVKKQSVLNHKS